MSSTVPKLYSRRSLVAVLAALSTVGMTAAVTVAANPVAGAATTIGVYNDKANWTTDWNEMGAIAAKDIGVGFKAVPFADTSTYQATMMASLPSTKAPALFTWWSGAQLTPLAKAGLLTPLNGLWNRYKEDYTAGLRKAFTYHGNVYAAPLYSAYWDVFYNKHVFARFHLHPPTTWAQFLHMCALLKAHGITPMAQTVAGVWPGFIWFEELMLRSYPAQYDRLMAGKISYTSPNVIRVMKLWRSLEKDGYFSNPGLSMGTAGSNNILPLFAHGQIAMFLIGDWYQTTMVSAGLKPGVDYGAFLLPDPNPKAGRVAILESGPLAIGAHAPAPQKAAAEKILAWWMQPRTQSLWAKLTGFNTTTAAARVVNPVDAYINHLISSEHYRLYTRFWEATPPPIAQTASEQFDRFELHPDQYMSVLSTIQSYASHYWATHK